jgi:glucose-1-phosphate thymidylyltransferase
MPKPFSIIVPMAGWGTRMRPHTWSRPKPLVSVAGKTVLDHLLEPFSSLPNHQAASYAFIVSPFLGENQIPVFMENQYPHLKVDYFVQEEMKGQSHAILLAGKHLHGPMIVIYADTLIEADFSFLADETADIIGWVKPVPDPRRFGVAVVNKSGEVSRLIEKPKNTKNNLAVVGCYYFREGRHLLSAIQEQIRRGVQIKGEYFLADAINIMLESGATMHTQAVDVWLDTGTIDSTLETNRYLLEHSKAGKRQSTKWRGVKINPPVFIHPSAEIHKSVIGPNASIGAECYINRAHIEDSILNAGAEVENAALKHSFIGQRAEVRGRSADDPPMILNVGDNSSVILK